MKMTRHGDHLIQLTRWPLLFPVNVYLVRENDGLTLIDTAVGGSTPAILAAAEQLGAPIARIVLTHGHGDHIGSLEALRAALTDVDVLMGAQTARFLAGDLVTKDGETGEKLPGSWKTCAVRPTHTIGPGDRIGSLEVIASPGHSPDHIAFLDTRDRILIAGDAFQTRGGVAVSGTLKPFLPFPAMATWSKAVALASARTLRSLEPTRLAVGHGRVLDQPLAAMDRAIAEAELKLAYQVRHAS